MAMATQTGVSLARILLLAGAGYTTTNLLKNGTLSDILVELQSLVKGLENSGQQSDDSDAILAQLSREIQELFSARQITVLNGNSEGKLANLIIPAAALGAFGYGYVWWKGISFSNLLWVTKRNMAIAVENLTKQLESVCVTVSNAKKHLTKRIQNLDDKAQTQKEISKSILETVEDVHSTLYDVEYDLDELQDMISGLDEKVDSIESKQNRTCLGLIYLCRKFSGYKVNKPELLKGLKAALREDVTNSGKIGKVALCEDVVTNPGKNGIIRKYEEPRSLQFDI